MHLQEAGPLLVCREPSSTNLVFRGGRQGSTANGFSIRSQWGVSSSVCQCIFTKSTKE